MPVKYFFVSRKTDKSFLKLPKDTQERIIKTYDALLANPIAGSKLSGQLEDYYKYRIGDYRIIYTFHPKTSTLEVVKIEHRQGVYK